MEIEEAVRRQSEANISHGEGFEVVRRRTRNTATGEKTKLVVEEAGLRRSGSRKDVSTAGDAESNGTGRGKWLQPSLLGNRR